MPFMQFFDTLTLDKRRLTKDGYLAVSALCARTGIQDYLGVEVDPDNIHGLRDKSIVKVYRPESEVFSTDSLASFAYRPITDNHPAESVNAGNWKALAKGVIGDTVARDGQAVRVSMLVMDSDSINAINDGKRELSAGYTAILDYAPGTLADGTKYDAVQRDIRINHVALVDRARGGSELRIPDGFSLCDSLPSDLFVNKEHSMPKTITLDGIPFKLDDENAVEALVNKLIGDKDALNTAVSAKDGEIAVLKQSLADAQANLTPAAIDLRVKDRAALIESAKSIKSDIVTDGKSEADIRREVVLAKIGDSASAFDDSAIAGAFSALKSIADSAPAKDDLAAIIADGVKAENPDDKVKAAREKMIAEMTRAKKKEA